MSALRETAGEMVEVARDAGADDAVVEVFDSSVDQVRFSNAMIDTSNSWRQLHAHVFVSVGGRTISSDLRDLRKGRKAVRQMVGLAKLSPVNEGYRGIASGRFGYRRGRADPRILSLKDPAKHVHEAIDAALSNGATDVGGTLFVRRSKWGIASTGGASADDANASIDLSVRAFSQPEASGQAVCIVSSLSKLRAAGTGEDAADRARAARDPVQGEEGRFDLVMEPLFVGSIVGPTTDMLSALSVELGMSMYDRKVGKKVASDEVTLADDPTVPSMTRRAFDHEGRPTRRVVAVKEGVLRTYLHSTSTARRFKARPTASAGPSVASTFKTPGEPVMFHPVLEPGGWTVDEMIADTRKGLYLNNAWYTRFQNYSTGDFSTIPRDAILLIRNGEVAGSVKNVRVSDNLMRLWKQVDALSGNAEETYWWDEARPPSLLPAARAKAMKVTRSS